jgi:hypothetical protein
MVLNVTHRAKFSNRARNKWLGNGPLRYTNYGDPKFSPATVYSD